MFSSIPATASSCYFRTIEANNWITPPRRPPRWFERWWRPELARHRRLWLHNPEKRCKAGRGRKARCY